MYLATTDAIVTHLRFFGLKLCGCSTAKTPAQPKVMHRLSPNFQGMFTPIGSKAD